MLGIQGTIVPLVTPFKTDEAFDRGAMGRLIDFVLEQGADALMPTALTGEGPLLDVEETIGVWDAVFEKISGALPIVPAVISTTTRRAIELVRAAEERGAAAVMVAPILPELYAGRSHDDVCGFYSDVATAVSLPIVLFNYPSLTGVDLTPPLLERLTEIETVRYIKESTGDAKRVHQIQRTVGDRLEVICGGSWCAPSRTRRIWISPAASTPSRSCPLSTSCPATTTPPARSRPRSAPAASTWVCRAGRAPTSRPPIEPNSSN